ncbi:MAG: hypothetical protein M3Q48_09795 [Actinomycetota bacterium]|nr:hypothetical protein [Actinomycetota bacterium]
MTHLPGCVENPRLEHYAAAGRRVTRCVDCGSTLVAGAAEPEVSARFDPDRNPLHPFAGMTMRGLTYDDLYRRGVTPADMTPKEHA